MKCPKCSFISFDYNDACPKCNKDLTNERDMMGLPSYKPKPLSVQASLNANNSDISDDMSGDTEVPLTEKTMDAVPDELLISLDDLSDDEPLAAQIESDDEPLAVQIESAPTEAEPELTVDDEIFLDLDLPDSEEIESDDEPLAVQMESAPTEAEPEQTVDDEIFLDLSLPDSEEIEYQENDNLDPEAIQEIGASIESNDTSEIIPDLIVKEETTTEITPDLFVKEETPGKTEETESIFELELEPLEFELDLEESDEKKILI